MFEGLPDYKTEVKTLETQAARLKKITDTSISGTAAVDVKNTAKWGILGRVAITVVQSQGILSIV